MNFRASGTSQTSCRLAVEGLEVDHHPFRVKTGLPPSPRRPPEWQVVSFVFSIDLAVWDVIEPKYQHGRHTYA